MNIRKREPIDKAGFAKRLRKARKATGITQEDFAFIVGYKVRQYRKFESDKEDDLPSLEAFSAITQEASTSPGHLLHGIGPEFMDMHSARKLQGVMDKAFDIDAPNYGVLIQDALKLTENQLQLLIDLIPVISGYDPVLDISFD